MFSCNAYKPQEFKKIIALVFSMFVSAGKITVVCNVSLFNFLLCNYRPHCISHLDHFAMFYLRWLCARAYIFSNNFFVGLDFDLKMILITLGLFKALSETYYSSFTLNTASSRFHSLNRYEYSLDQFHFAITQKIGFSFPVMIINSEK